MSLINLAVWLYDDSSSTTVGFWMVVLDENERGRFDAIVAGLNTELAAAGGKEWQVGTWEDARGLTRDAIKDNGLAELYDSPSKPTDEVMFQYWNYANVGGGGRLTLAEFLVMAAPLRMVTRATTNSS